MKAFTAISAGVLAMAVLPGCVSDMRDTVAREAAKSAVRPVLERRLPGVPVEPAVNCVIDNASADEIVTLARDGALAGEVSPATRRIVADILLRRGTIECLAEDGLPVLLESL